MGLARVLPDLVSIRDAEQLPVRGPVRSSPEHLRRLERKQLVVERVDEEGISHPVVLEGDTREGWAGRDFVRNVLRR